LVERRRAELGEGPELKVGIVWHGSQANVQNRERSIPLEQFIPLAQVEGVRLFSLQVGAGREQLAALGADAPIVELGDRLGDFHDTAALVKNLDLVITCDSAPAHLAGALGIPVWVALSFAPDWRWMLGRGDSPWYPTMRLFRQAHAGDWQAVFHEIERELSTMAPTARRSNGNETS